MNYKKIQSLIILLILLMTAFFSGTTALADDSITVKVGIYENEPKIFTDEQGTPSGFWPEIIEYISASENWEIEYVPGTWNQCMDRLENGEIDMMPDVAYTDKRNLLYRFSEEPVYTSWSRIYTTEGNDIQSIIDLEGLHIAVLKGSVNIEGPEGIKTLTDSFNVDCTFVEANSYLSVFQLVASGDVEAGVSSKDFGNLHKDEFNLVDTPIIFQPSSLYFAFPGEAGNAAFLSDRIDFNVRQLKADPESIYYGAIEKWFGGTALEKTVFPEWIKWVLIGLGAILVLIIFHSVIVRSQVKSRTKALSKSLEERSEIENFLEKVVEHSPDPMWISDSEGYIIRTNQALRDMLLVTDEEIIGKYNVLNDSQVNEQGYLDLVKRVFSEGINTEFTIDYNTENEKQVELKKTVHKILDIVMTPLKNSENEITNVISIQKDVTEQRHAERDLQAEKERVEEYLTIADVILLVIDIDQNVSLINRKGCEILGYKSEEILGTNWFVNYLPERYQEGVGRYWDQLKLGIAEGVTYFENPVVTKEGKERLIAWNNTVLKDRDGNFTGTLSSGQDITEQKQTEETLRLFDAALKSIRDCVYIMDTDFRVTYWNEMCEKTFGIKASDAVGKIVGELMEMVEDYPGQNRERIEYLMEQGYNHEEQQYITPRGKIWVDVHVQSIEQDNERYGWVTITTDISERKLTQKRQRLLLEILEELNSRNDRIELFSNLIALIKDYSGIEAIGIRLKSGDDYPYIMYEGFTNGHIEQENFLCSYDIDGNAVTDKTGKPVLQCLCGMVIQGYSDSSLPLFTETGGFWTNSASRLPGSITNNGSDIIMRNLCTTEGFESIAIIPIRSTEETIGLLQLNDSRQDMFTPESVQLFENVATSIGIALDRTLAQEELEREKQSIERIVSTAQTIILVLDTDGSIAIFNPYMEELSGYSIDEVRGKNWFDIFLPERDRENVRQLFYKTFEESTTEGAVNPIVTRDGRERQIVWNHTPIRDEDGNVSGLLSTGQDITDLRQAEELYDTIAFNSPVGVYISQDNHLRFVNPEFERLAGYRGDELVNVDPYKFIHPDDKKTARDNSIKMLKGKLSTPYEFRVLGRDGKVRWVMESVASIHFNGKPAVLGSFMDITESKTAAEIIRQSEEKLKIIIESIPQGIMVTDLEGNIVQVNPSMVSIFGYDSETQIIGKNALDLAVDSDREMALEEITRARDEKRKVSFEYTARKNDGSTFNAVLSAAMLYDSDGKGSGVIGLVEDITEVKKMQQQLMVTDRLASVGELAAGIAHELNNPLTGVVGFSDLLVSREDIPKEIKDDLEMINREALRASQVARHLLTFARKHPDEKNPVSVNDIIHLVMELRAYEQKVSNITAQLELTPDLPEVLGNAFQLQQVFLNIIINAEFFMTETNGKGTLMITTEKADDQVRIIFKDDGPGIPTENLSQIFNPFYTTKVIGKGTGLGLSICHGIISEHGGTISAESETGKGARFIIELPAYQGLQKGG